MKSGTRTAIEPPCNVLAADEDKIGKAQEIRTEFLAGGRAIRTAGDS